MSEHVKSEYFGPNELNVVEEILEVIPIEYRVEVFDGGPSPRMQVVTYGNWNIESKFLITYDVNGLRSAILLPENCSYITTVEVPDPASKIVVEEEDGENA